MKKSSKQFIISLVLIGFGFAAIFVLSDFLEKNRPPNSEEYEDSETVLQGAKLKGFSFGMEGLIADWYWMKSLQYIGGKFLAHQEDASLDNLKPLNPRLLYPYLDNATTLDPKFLSVYEYGATVLPAIDKDEAIKFTEKGIADNPQEWRLYQYLGFIYWRLNDYEKAAEVYEKGTQIAGAPEFMRLMAAKMKTEGGSRQTARVIYEQMFEESQEEQTKQNAQSRLLRLDSLDEQEIIQKVLTDFKLKNNRCANSWREILPPLQKEKLPGNRNFSVDNASNLIDPSGAAYLLDRQNCAVELDAQKTKIPLN